MLLEIFSDLQTLSLITHIVFYTASAEFIQLSMFWTCPVLCCSSLILWCTLSFWRGLCFGQEELKEAGGMGEILFIRNYLSFTYIVKKQPCNWLNEEEQDSQELPKRIFWNALSLYKYCKSFNIIGIFIFSLFRVEFVLVCFFTVDFVLLVISRFLGEVSWNAKNVPSTFISMLIEVLSWKLF